MAYVDFRHGYRFVPVVELITVLLAPVAYFLSGRPGRERLSVWMLTVPVFLIYAGILFTQIESRSSLSWLPVFPILFFLRYREGLWLSLLALFTLIVAYTVYFLGIPKMNGALLLEVLEPGFAFLLSLTIFALLEHRRQQDDARMVDDARRDTLTGLWNRRAFEERLADEIARAERYPNPFCLILIDLDHFKQVNDSGGHAAGDTALKQLALVLQESARSTDFVCRWGGEEFAVLAIGVDLADGIKFAEKLRVVIEQGPSGIPTTISAGIAGHAPGRDASQLWAAADAALYRAKHAGRNRVEADFSVQQAGGWREGAHPRS